MSSDNDELIPITVHLDGKAFAAMVAKSDIRHSASVAPVAPSVGRIVYYRLTREDVKAINRRYQNGVTHYIKHRQTADGSQIHVGNQMHRGDIVPLIIVRVWENEYNVESPVCKDYEVGEESPEFSLPISHWGINGQAMLDGNDSLWITSSPNGSGNGFWDWPARV